MLLSTNLLFVVHELTHYHISLIPCTKQKVLSMLPLFTCCIPTSPEPSPAAIPLPLLPAST